MNRPKPAAFAVATAASVLLATLSFASPADAQRRGGGGRSPPAHVERPSGRAEGRPNVDRSKAKAPERANVNTANRANASAGNRNEVKRADTNIRQTNIDNRDVNVNVNRDVDVHGGYGYHYDNWGAPIAAAAVVTATALAVGTMVAALPTSGCNAVTVGGVGYQHCGSTYYQPVYQGSQVQYVVVEAPR